MGALYARRVLDVGCGPGYWNRVFGEFNLEYCGIDISTSSVELAKISQRIFGLKGKVFVCNAENLAFPSKYFDYIISEDVIHHTPDTQKCIDEIYRVLKDAGTALISVYHQNFILRSKMVFKIVRFFMGLMNIRLLDGAVKKYLPLQALMISCECMTGRKILSVNRIRNAN